ncbi:MAG: hypothetical protein ACYTAO_10690, partial [Planctomycetota bacterium]
MSDLRSCKTYIFDQLLDQSIEIKISTQMISPTGVRVVFAHGSYEFYKWESGTPFRTVDHEGHYRGSFSFGETRRIKFFRFKNLVRHDDTDPGSLRPPNGANLFSVVFSSKALRETMVEFFRKYGLKVNMKPQESVFEL